jgi:hypothetical protein
MKRDRLRKARDERRKAYWPSPSILPNSEQGKSWNPTDGGW